jgi:ABC-type uncharacterized transport system substrate-binding protein
VKRRQFIALVGCAAALRPVVSLAQQPERVRRVGVLIPLLKHDPSAQAFTTAFAQALARLGWAEGNNIRIDYRFAGADPALFKTHAAELIGMSPDTILAGSTPSTAALWQQTRTIPIVFVLVGDPVGQGFVQSLAHLAATSLGSPLPT